MRRENDLKKNDKRELSENMENSSKYRRQRHRTGPAGQITNPVHQWEKTKGLFGRT